MWSHDHRFLCHLNLLIPNEEGKGTHMLRMHWLPKMCAGDPAIVSTCQTSRRRRHKRRKHWFHLKGKTFCLHSIGENLVIWTYPVSRQAGKCSFKINNYILSYSVPRQVARMWDQLEVSATNIFFIPPFGFMHSPLCDQSFHQIRCHVCWKLLLIYKQKTRRIASNCRCLYQITIWLI